VAPAPAPPQSKICGARSARSFAASRRRPFPKRTFDITAFRRGPTVDLTRAGVSAAIAACAAAGGGQVVVPRDSSKRTIALRSQVDLHLTDDAVLAFSRDPKPTCRLC
jgi:polygalacturonase